MPIATKSDKIELSSEKNIEELAAKFLNKIKPGDIIFLYGEIGVGKTTFVRYLVNKFPSYSRYSKKSWRSSCSFGQSWKRFFKN